MDKTIQITVNVKGELRLMKEYNQKPNFSDMSRKYQIDRHKISKMYYSDGEVIAQPRKQRKSFYDQYYDEVKDLFDNSSNTIMGIFMYLKNKFPNEKHNYNTFKSFARTKGLRITKTDKTPHVRYETKPGDQLQLDWKEDVKIHLKNGEEIIFNVLNGTLGYSRYHTFVYSKNRTTEDLLRGLVEIYNRLGGKTKRITTDNMSCIVSITNGNKMKHNKIKQFEKDTDIKINLCKVRTPQTKGKVESSMRFLNWINAYDGKIENENELINVVRQIEIDCNNEKNQTTLMPPRILFDKEKEYLDQFNFKLTSTYLENVITQTVPSTMLINYKGSQYSVPKEYIGKSVKIIPIHDTLYINDNTKLITIHQISTNKINYKLEDYKDGLCTVIKSTEQDIDKMALENLQNLNKITKGGIN